MKVKLKKENRTFASSVDYFSTSIERGIGMMFRMHGSVLLAAEHESILETTIHTFFCMPLFVAWINSKHRVVAVKKTFPFWFYSSSKPAKYVFETTNLKTKLKPGDIIKFIAEKKHT